MGGGGDTDMAAKLLHLETEVTAKKGEITALREQVGWRWFFWGFFFPMLLTLNRYLLSFLNSQT